MNNSNIPQFKKSIRKPTISICIDQSTIDKLKELAEKENLSVSNTIQQILDNALKPEES